MKKELHLKDRVGIFLIIIGILIMVYPQLRSYYFDKRQDKLLHEYLESMEAIEVIEEDNDNEDISNSFENSFHNENNSENNTIENENNSENSSLDEVKKEDKKDEMLEKWPVEGTLHIDKIDLEMPIIAGASKEHLNISVASIENTGKPWEGGNYAIAGHRSRAHGRHFNRLNELEIGDKIIVEDRQKVQYIYEVYSKIIVNEREISVLEDKGISEITLITCDPINQKNPPTRLIVKGKEINL